MYSSLRMAGRSQAGEQRPERVAETGCAHTGLICQGIRNDRQDEDRDERCRLPPAITRHDLDCGRGERGEAETEEQQSDEAPGECFERERCPASDSRHGANDFEYNTGDK